MKLFASAIAVMLLAAVHEQATADGPDHYRVTGVEAGDTLSIRAEPSTKAEKIGEIPPQGVCIRNLGCQGGLTYEEFMNLSKNQPTFAEETIRCNPNTGPSYKLCSVREMPNKEVRLSRQLSSSPCIQGKSSGRHRHGVWVDNGCRAEFKVSRRGSGPRYDKNSRADAAAAVEAAGASDGGFSEFSNSDGYKFDSHGPTVSESIPRFAVCDVSKNRRVTRFEFK